MFKHRKFVSLSIIVAISTVLLGGSLLPIQGATPEPPSVQSDITETPIVSDTPLPIPTDMPTLDAPPTELPNPTETPIPPTEVTEIIPTDSVPETTATVTPIAQPTTGSPILEGEPPLSLLLYDSFDAGIHPIWGISSGLAYIPGELGGQAVQIYNAAQPVLMQAPIIDNVVIQGRFIVDYGAARLHVRYSDTGSYSAMLENTGRVSLWRNEDLLAEIFAQPSLPGYWRTLRFSVVDDVLRAALDGIEVLAIRDTSPLPSGVVGFSGKFADIVQPQLPQNTLRVDDVTVWVPEQYGLPMIAPLPSPTIETVNPTPTATMEVTPDITPESTEVLEATIEATSLPPTEGTATPEAKQPVGEATIESIDAFSIPKPSAAPVLLQPALNSLTNNNTPTFSWSTVANAQGYIIQVDDVSTFGSPQIDRTVSSTTFTSDVLLSDKKYYWHVRALNAMGEGAWSSAGNFTVDTAVPNAPVVTSPADLAVIQTVRPVLNWTKVSDASGYVVDIASDVDFTTHVINNSPVTALSYTATTDFAQGKYYWRIAAKDAAGNISAYSEKRQFIVNLARTPAEGAVVSPVGTATTVSPTFNWTGVSGATGYTVEIDDTPDFLTPLYVSSSINTTTFVLPVANALPLGSYYWHVLVNGIQPVSIVSLHFYISPLPPIAPTYPTTGGTSGFSSDLSPDLIWNAVTYAPSPITYEVQIDNQSTFSSPEFALTGITGTIQTVTPDLAEGSYSWHVRAVNQWGAPGLWSSTKSLIIDTTAPTAPTLNTPANDAILNVLRPPLTWTAVSDAKNYLIDVATDETFNTKVIDAAPSTTPSFTATTNLSQGIYYWRVSAQDAAGNIGIPSSSRKFTLTLLKTPLNNAVLTATAPQAVKFTWAAIPGAGTYEVQVASDEAFTQNVYTSAALPNAISSFTLPTTNLLPFGVYYWRVNIAGIPSSIIWMFTISPAAPAAPTYPISGGTATSTNDTTPDLIWNAVNYPASTVTYELQVDNNNTFASPEFSAVGINTTLQTVSPDLIEGAYSWHVRAINQWGIASNWSAARPLLIDLTPPTAPTLQLPFDNTVQTTFKPALSWNPVITAASYLVEIASDENFNNKFVTNAPVSLAKYTPANNLAQGLYYWHVAAVDTAGNIGPYSTLRRFIISILKSPLDSSVVITATGTTSASPLFSWTAFPSATGYTLKIATDTNFTAVIYTSPLLPASTTSHKVATPLIQGVYYWQVIAEGFPSVSTVLWKVIVTPALPSAPKYPMTGGTELVTNDTTPDLIWTAVNYAPTALTYDVEIDNNNTFTSPEFKATNISSVQQAVTPELAQGTYFWHVRAVNSFGAPGLWSIARSLTIDTTPPLAPVLVSPPDQVIFNVMRPPLTWKASASAVSYILDVASNEDFTTLDFPSVSLTKLTFTSTANLAQGLHYWRVSAVDAAGNISPASSRRFTVNILKTPLNNAILIAKNATLAPVLTWNTVVGATGFTIQIATDTEFSQIVYVSPLLGGKVITYTLPEVNSLTYGTYYWRVNISGQPSVSPVYWKFVVSPTPPSAPTYPDTNGTPGYTPAPLPDLIWDPVTYAFGSVTYDVELDNSSTFTSPEFKQSGITDTKVQVSIPLADGRYYWHVRAVNSYGAPGVWGVSQLLIIGAPPIAPSNSADPIFSSNPANGESGVAITRETILRFRDPINPATVNSNVIQVAFSDQILATRLHVSPDRKTVTIFYLPPLPTNARVTVKVDGNALKGANGIPVDVDLDGTPGGVANITFDTLTLTVIPGTEVCGRVFASALNQNDPNQSVNDPLQGATITVDTLETILFTKTDAAGNFCLNPAPAGRFFVHVDGRTATNNVPSGAYYPFVGKPWESVPGTSVNIGNVYLPLVVNGTLQPVSQNQDVTIKFPPAVQNEFPGFNDVQIVVPANSLYSDNGQRGGKVGIAPVPPDRIPGQLPPDLKFPIVITVQTDGATNFDVPAPVCFPNLPSSTNPALPAGSKSALWSFNHDVGEFQIVGSMTVSADAKVVCTDPGVGIRAPGWHATFPGTQSSNDARNPNPPCPKKDCAVGVYKIFKGTAKAIKDVGRLAAPLEAGIAGATAGMALGPGGAIAGFNLAFVMTESVASRRDKVANIVKDMAVQVGKDALAHKSASDILTGAAKKGLESTVNNVALNSGNPYLTYANAWRSAISNAISLGENIAKFTNNCLAKVAACFDSASIDQLTSSFVMTTNMTLISGNENGLNTLNLQVTDYTAAYLAMAQNYGWPTPTQAEIDDFNTLQAEIAAGMPSLSAAHKELYNITAAYAKVITLLHEPNPTEQTITQLQAQLDYLVSKENSIEDFSSVIAASQETYRQQGFPLVQENSELITEELYYHYNYNGLDIRGKSTGGHFKSLLPANADVILSVYQPTTGMVGSVNFDSGASGTNAYNGPIVLGESLSPDSDNDGLSDEAEDIIGTNPNAPDTDSDGIKDGAEVQAGTDPLDNVPARTGIISTVDTIGLASDVCVSNNLAAVADGTAGVAVFNVFNGMNPTILSEVNTPGNAVMVACDNNYVAAADSTKGVAVINLNDPSLPVRKQVTTGSVAQAVAASGGLAYAGLDTGEIVLIDMSTAIVLDRLAVASSPIMDVALAGDYLYVLTSSNLYTVALRAQQFNGVTGNLSLFGANRRLNMSSSIGYVLHTRGYTTINMSNPASPTANAFNNQNQFGWTDLAINGSGLGVMTVGLNSSGEPHDVWLYDVSNPAVTNTFLTQFLTPGISDGISIYNGLAYVADGAAGMQVINYRPYDAQGVAPTISLTSNVVGGNAVLGSLVRVSANVTDDVQVRNVEFLVNGTSVLVDGTFPFEYRFVAPSGSFSISARAVDTGGNTVTSSTLNVTAVPDTTPPNVSIISPTAGQTIPTSSSIAVRLNATDNVGIAGVTLLLNGNPVPTTRVASNVYITPAPANVGTVTLTASVTDPTGLSATSAPISLEIIQFATGITINAALDYGGDGDVYTFNVTAQKMYYFDYLSGSNMTWRLLGPGNLFIFGQSFSDVARLVLSVPGTYTLQIYGNNASVTGNYSFKIWEVVDQNINYVVGDTVSNGVPAAGAGNIEIPGTRDLYYFDATAGQTLFFDALTPLSGLAWRLVTPGGTVVFDQAFGDYWRYKVLKTGKYRLELSASANNPNITGVYSFKVRLSQDQMFAYTIGTTVSNGAPSLGAGNIENPGDQDLYTFNATAGKILYFDQISSASNLAWALKAPDGTDIFDAGLTDAGTRVLNQTGTYQIRVTASTNQIDATGTYSFQVYEVVPTTYALNIGDTVSNGVPAPGAGNIETITSVDAYTINNTAPSVVLFDILSGATSSRYWLLTAPDGTSLLFNQGFSSDLSIVLPQIGTYTLRLGGSLTGTYSFKLTEMPSQLFENVTLGSTISNNIPATGAGNLETSTAWDIYGFNLTAGQSIYVDTNNTSLIYNIYSATGIPITANTFYDTAFTAPTAGTYFFAARAYSTFTGTYSFAVWDATPQTFNYTLDSIVSNWVPSQGAGNIETPGARDIYTFAGTNGQRVYFDMQGSTGIYMQWKLTNPDGGINFDWTANEVGLITLPQTGTYRLEVRDDDDDTGNYNFKIWNVAPDGNFVINIGDVVSNGVPGVGAGNIETASNRDVYTFAATAGQQVNFDEIYATDSNIYWQLKDPIGNVIFTDYFGGSDAGLRTLTAAGTYRLEIYDSYNDGIGLYSFALRVVPVSQTFNIAIGDTVSNGVPSVGAGNLEAIGSRDIYTFTADAGQQVYFDELSNTNSYLYWMLKDSSGTQIFNEQLDTYDKGLVILDDGGTYTIEVYSYNGTPGTYSIKLINVPQPLTYALTLGNTVSEGIPGPGAGKIDVSGEKDNYRFSGVAGQKIYFDEISGSNSLSWKLTDPGGNLVFNNNLDGYDPGLYTLSATGTYIIEVTGNSGATGSYSFRTWNILAPQTFTINIGTTVSNGSPAVGAGNIETIGATDSYSFTATAGQQVYFDEISGDYRLNWQLKSSNGTVIFTDGALDGYDPGIYTLTAGGTYTIDVYPEVDYTGTYSFRITNVSAPQTFSINVGTTVTNGVPGTGAGNIESPGVLDIYTFAATAGQQVYFDEIAGASGLYWRLKTPTSSVLFNTTLDNSYSDPGTYTLTAGGNYTIEVYGQTDFTGSYSFNIRGVQAGGGAISVGSTSAGNIENSSVVDTYTFTASAGQKVYFDEIYGSYYLNWQLKDTNGTVIFNDVALDGSSDPGNFVLSSTGVYTIEVTADSGGFGDYSFNIRNTANQTFAYTIDDTVSENVPQAGAGNIEDIGLQDSYTFTATAGQFVYFDILNSYNSNLTWRLKDTSGSILFNNPIYQETGVTLASAGTYTLEVYSSSGGYGTYTFAIRSVTPTQTFAISLGTVVSNGIPSAGAGNIETWGSMDRYTFTIPVRQSIFFDAISSTSGTDLDWRLKNSAGTTVYSDGGGGFSDSGSYDLPADSYTLEIYEYANRISVYSFQLITAPAPQRFTYAIGGVVSNGIPAAGAGNLDAAGAVDIYTFNATAGQQVYFDEISGSYQLYWRLKDFAGNFIFNDNALDNSTDPGKYTFTAGGIYTLEVYSYGLGTGSYSFQTSLVPAPQIFSLNIGTVVSNGVPSKGAGNIEAAGAVDRYSFNATAGQQVYFDEIAGVSSLNWQVKDANGTVIFTDYYLDGSYDPGKYTLSLGGVYTIEVYGDQAETGIYSFQLRNVPSPQTFTYTLGNFVSDGVPAVGAGNLEASDSVDIYSFTVPANQVIGFDAVYSTVGSYLYWSVKNAAGNTVASGYFTDSGPYTLTTTGKYTLEIYDYYDTQSIYSFRLVNAAPQTFAYTIGNVVSSNLPGSGAGNIEVPGTFDLYTFTGTANQQIAFDAISSTANAYLYWEIRNAADVYIYSGGFSDSSNFNLPTAGTYTLKLYGSSGATSIYSFRLINVPAPQTFAYTIGNTVSNNVPQAGAGNLEVWGAIDRYTFTATANQRISFDAISSSLVNGLSWTLKSSIGTLITNGSYTDSGPYNLTVAGTYTLEVYAYSGQTGVYSFKLINVPIQTFSYTIGTVISADAPLPGEGNIEAKGSSDYYTFTATAGQQISFDAISSTSGTDLDWYIRNNVGTVVAYDSRGGLADSGPYTLSAAGTYTLEVFEYGNDQTATYSFALTSP